MGGELEKRTPIAVLVELYHQNNGPTKNIRHWWSGDGAPGAHSPHVSARSIRWRNFTRLAAVEPPPYRPLMESRRLAREEISAEKQPYDLKRTV